ncbi:MAG: hypothetical protein M5R40_29565 [Anaerolineae bacterium]|nr:hypothetical protein [Anaerolineae bacterium]
MHTTSVHDLANMTRQLKGVYDTTEKLFGKGNGFYLGVPIILRRTPRMISTPGEEGKRVRRLKYLISIEVDPAWVAEAQRVLQQRALPGGAGPALPARVVVPGGHEPTEPPANWQRTSFVGDELDDEDDAAFVEGEVAVEDAGAGDPEEADYEPPFPPGAGEGATEDAAEDAAGAGYDWLKARAKLVMRLKNGGGMTPQQAADLLEDLRRAGAIRTEQDDDSILAVARASAQATEPTEVQVEAPADAGVPAGAPAGGETTDAPHWTAQPSKKRPGLTNWEAFVGAAADKWAYSEADILRCFRVEKPEAIAPDMEAAWVQLKAWDPQRDPDWAQRGDLLALIKLEVWLCPEGTDAAAVALLNAAHAGGAFDELPTWRRTGSCSRS